MTESRKEGIEKKAILLERRTDNGMWCIPGGALELGEDFIDGLKREVKEETNLDINNPELYTIRSGIHMVYPNGVDNYIQRIRSKVGHDKMRD